MSYDSGSIELYPDKKEKNGCPIKRVHFKFPVAYNGESVYDILSPLATTDETVVLLSKGVIDSQKVKVEFSLEDMDTASFHGKATYEQLKDYVLQQTGMKVSSLCISQVKRKCGLEVGDSCNKPKSEGAKQPQCPPEKEAAIIDALKHFGIIE